MKIKRLLNKGIGTTGDMVDGKNITSMVEKKVWNKVESFERYY